MNKNQRPAAACQRIGPVPVEARWTGENLSESVVLSSFLRYMVFSSVLVLKMSSSPPPVPPKSCPSWLCNRNPSSPLHCETPLWNSLEGQKIVWKVDGPDQIDPVCSGRETWTNKLVTFWILFFVDSQKDWLRISLKRTSTQFILMQ